MRLMGKGSEAERRVVEGESRERGEKNCKKKIKRQQVGKGRQERETEV